MKNSSRKEEVISIEFSFSRLMRSLREDDSMCWRSISRGLGNEMLPGGCLSVAPNVFIYISTMVSRTGSLGIIHPRSLLGVDKWRRDRASDDEFIELNFMVNIAYSLCHYANGAGHNLAES